VHTIVEPFVATAQDQETVHGGEVLDHRLVHRLAGGVHEQDEWRHVVERRHLAHRPEQRLGSHHHAGTAAVRRIVHLTVHPRQRPVAQVVDVKVE